MARVHDNVIEIEDDSDNEDGNVPPDNNILIAIHAKNNHIFQHNSLRQEMSYTHFIVTMPPANVTNLPLSNNSGNDIILKVAAEIMTVPDFNSIIRHNGWLTDQAVNMYFKHVLDARAMVLSKKNPSQRPWISVLCFFIADLLHEHDPHRAGQFIYKKYLKKVDLMKVRGIMVPHNINKNHWVLFTVDFDKKEMCLYDSIASARQKDISKMNLRFDALKKYLTKRKELLPTTTPELNFATWKFKMTDTKNCTQQTDRYNCGVYCCLYADWLQLDYPVNFATTLVPYYRNFMLQQMLNFMEKST